MIKLTKLADYFEKGLNSTLNNPEIQFKIWADAGKFQKPFRDGNSITHYVNGNLKTSTSANDANDLEMGVNGLSLEFAIETQMPRTNGTQTAEELAKIKEGQYPYISYITSAINKFFSTAQVASLKDDDNTEFSISWLAGTAVTGDVDIRPVVGQSILFTVYIEITFVEGGVSSRLVKVYIDDSPIPIKAIRHGRSPMLERDVYADKLTSKNVATSTAFSIDVEFPANKDTATKVCLDYLFNGEPNVAHFVNVKFGDLQEQLYLMTLNTVQTAVQGISIAGITASLIEVIENILAINVPDGFQVGKFTFATSDAESLTFTPSEDCLAYVAGQAIKLTGVNPHTVALETSAMHYNYDNGVYEVYLVTNKAIRILRADVPFAVAPFVEYEISFDSNGGSPVESLKATNLPDPLPVSYLAGYTFHSWKKSQEFVSDTAIPGEQIYSDTRLYARWRLNTPVISIQDNKILLPENAIGVSKYVLYINDEESSMQIPGTAKSIEVTQTGRYYVIARGDNTPIVLPSAKSNTVYYSAEEN